MFEVFSVPRAENLQHGCQFNGISTQRVDRSRSSTSLKAPDFMGSATLAANKVSGVGISREFADLFTPSTPDWERLSRRGTTSTSRNQVCLNSSSALRRGNKQYFKRW